MEIVEEVYEEYPTRAFTQDLEAALTKFWRSPRTKAPLAKFKKFHDYELGYELSFWAFFILLAQGHTRTSFLPLLASNMAVSEEDLTTASYFVSDYEGVREMEFAALAGLVALNQGDYHNF